MTTFKKVIILLPTLIMLCLPLLSTINSYADDDTYVEVRFKDGTSPVRFSNDAQSSFAFTIDGFKVTDKDGKLHLFENEKIDTIVVMTPLPEIPDTTYHAEWPIMRPEYFYGDFFGGPRVVRTICNPDGSIDTRYILDSSVMRGTLFENWTFNIFGTLPDLASGSIKSSMRQSDDFYVTMHTFYPRTSYLFGEPGDFCVEEEELDPYDESLQTAWGSFVKIDDPTSYLVGVLSEETPEDVKSKIDSIAGSVTGPLRIKDLLPVLASGLQGDDALKKLPDGVYGGCGRYKYKYGFRKDKNLDIDASLPYYQDRYFANCELIKIDGRLFKFSIPKPQISYNLQTIGEDDFSRMKILTINVDQELPDGNIKTSVLVDSLYCANYTVLDENRFPIESGKWCSDWGASLLTLRGEANVKDEGYWGLRWFTGKILSTPDWIEPKADKSGDELIGYTAVVNQNDQEVHNVFKQMYRYGDDTNERVYNVRKGTILVEKDGKEYSIPVYQEGYDWLKLDVDSIHFDAAGGEFKITGTTNTTCYDISETEIITDYDWIEVNKEEASRLVFPENGKFALPNCVVTPNPYSTPRRREFIISLGNATGYGPVVIYQEGSASPQAQGDTRTQNAPKRLNAVKYSDFKDTPPFQALNEGSHKCEIRR